MQVTQFSYLFAPRRSAPCDRCGRVLRDPISVSFGRGPVCRRYNPVTVVAQEDMVLDPAVVTRIMAAKEEPSEPTTELVVDLAAPRSTTPPPSPVFMSWGVPDKTRSIVDVFLAGVDYYRETRGQDPRVVITRGDQAKQLVQDPRVAHHDLEVRAGSFVPAGSFLIGMESGGAGSPVIVGNEVAA